MSAHRTYTGIMINVVLSCGVAPRRQKIRERLVGPILLLLAASVVSPTQARAQSITNLSNPNLRLLEEASPTFNGALNAYYTAIQQVREFYAKYNPALFQTILDGSMSCPVFSGEGTLLDEDSCAWARTTGQRIDQYASGGQAGYQIEDMTYNIGGQKEFAPDWFMGGSFTGGTNWSHDGGGGDGNGHTIDGSIALKHTLGPWLLAGALALGSTSSNLSSPSTSPGAGNLRSDTNTFSAAGRLRVAYDFSFDGWYMRPRADLDVIYTHLPAFNLIGHYGLGAAMDSTDEVSPVLTPMMEFGGRYDVGVGLVMRPYIAAGISYYPNSSHGVAAHPLIDGNTLGTFDETYNTPSVVGNTDAGVQIYQVNGFEVKAEYDVSAANTFLSQSVSLRAAYHF